MQFLVQTLNLAMIVFSALMIWKGLMVVTKSESPVVVVLRCERAASARAWCTTCPNKPPLRRPSGSMEPAFQRGDILFLNNQDTPIDVGEIVVFKIDGRDIPIVHRVLNLHEGHDGQVDLLTKGDNNMVHDRGLYKPGQLWLQRDQVLGRAVAYVGCGGGARPGGGAKVGPGEGVGERRGMVTSPPVSAVGWVTAPTRPDLTT